MFFLRNKILAFIIAIILSICGASLSNKIFPNSEDKTGIKLAIKEELLESLKSKFFPGLIESLANYTLSDQEISLDLKITKLNINLKNILINLNTTEITEENFQVTFQEPNKISVELKNISGLLNFDNTFQLSLLKESSHFTAEIFSFNLKIDLSLGEAESKTNKGKMLPLISLQNVEINLDFNYEIKGDFLISIANNQFVKGLLIKLIKSQINNIFSSTVKKSVNNYLANTISSLSGNLIFTENGLALDYEVLSSPKITNGKILSLNTKGLIFNANNSETNNPPYNFTANIPDFNESDKVAEFIISEFTINSALYTFFLSDLLKAKIDSKLIPADFPVKLNTTALDIIFNGVANKYGLDKPVELDCKAQSAPLVKFSEENFDINLLFECRIFVITDESQATMEQAYRFNSSVLSNLNLTLNENGNAKVNLNRLNLQNSVMIETTVEETDIGNIENWVNFGFNVAAPYLNKQYLNNVKIPIPVIKGIDISNSTINVRENYIDIHLTPNIDSFLAKKELKFLN